MKKTYLFIALAMVAAMTVSCKNNNKKAAKTAEANAEVVEAAKIILADDVLATIDEIAQAFLDESKNVIITEIISSSLTDEEKLVKPDYLLEAAQVNELVTKSQKLNALAILFVERYIRQAYGMSTEETDKVSAHLIAELNHPVLADEMNNLSPSEKARKTYETCKENGEVPYYWQWAFAMQIEYNYLISKNADVFFRNITKEQFDSFAFRYRNCRSALRILAEYDEEIASILKAHDASRVANSDEESDILFATKESAKEYMVASKDIIASRRAALLK